jgi:hypothetical protein
MPTLTLDFLTQQAEQESIYAIDDQQRELCQQWLWPNVQALQEDFLRLRLEFDRSFAPVPQPGRHYPIGYCREISIGVFNLLQKAIAAPPTPGISALRNFCAAGGRVKRVWGDLRHSYFQNAFQAGDMYIDAANDSVVITKPKVEILPLEKADFFPLNDFESYARLAEIYWKGQVYPNRYLPHLAPVFPILLVYPNGHIKLHSQYQTPLYLNLVHDFALAENFLLDSAWSKHEMLPPQMTQLERQVGASAAWQSAPLSDNALADIFNDARDRDLRLDATRLQVLLDQAVRING